MSTWLAKMLADTGLSMPESEGIENSTSIAQAAPNTSAAEASPAAVAAPVVSDRRRLDDRLHTHGQVVPPGRDVVEEAVIEGEAVGRRELGRDVFN